MDSIIRTTLQIAQDALIRATGTPGGGGGGITQLFGDVLAGPGAGAQAATVVRVNGATVPAAGALTTGAVLRVTGVSSLGYGPVNLALAAAVTGLLPVANIAPGANTQILTTTGGVAVWAAAGGGGGITQLTSDVLAGPGAGSQAATVVQITGSAGVATVINGTDLSFLTTGSAVSTNGRINFTGDVAQTWIGFHWSGSDFALVAVDGAGNITIGDAGAGRQLTISSPFVELFAGGNNITLSATGMIANTTKWTFASTPTFFDSASNVQIGAVTDTWGSGAGVLGIANATANPSTNPVGGGVLYASGGSLFWRNPAGVVTPIAP